MVPRDPTMLHDRENEPVSGSDDSDAESNLSASVPGAEILDDQEDMEREYHTEDSDDDSEIEARDSDIEVLTASGPLLPQELLKSDPGAPSSPQHWVEIPREQMTREQKVAQRSRDRKSKKRVWDRLMRDSKGTGVLEAGKFAQLKRGILLRRDKVKDGRVTKKRKAETKVSGRQQLLESRKVAVEQSRSQLMRPAKKRKTTGSHLAGAG